MKSWLADIGPWCCRGRGSGCETTSIDPGQQGQAPRRGDRSPAFNRTIPTIWYNACVCYERPQGWVL